MSISLEQIRQNINALNTAYQQSLQSGGISSYTINSGQGSTSVRCQSSAEILEQIKYWTYMENETKAHQSGSHVTIARDLDDFRRHYKHFK